MRGSSNIYGYNSTLQREGYSLTKLLAIVHQVVRQWIHTKTSLSWPNKPFCRLNSMAVEEKKLLLPFCCALHNSFTAPLLSLRLCFRTCRKKSKTDTQFYLVRLRKLGQFQYSINSHSQKLSMLTTSTLSEDKYFVVIYKKSLLSRLVFEIARM